MLLKNVKVLRPKTTKIQKRNGIGYVYQVIGKSYKKDKKYTVENRKLIGKMIDEEWMIPNEYFEQYYPDVCVEQETPEFSDTLRIGCFLVVQKLFRDLQIEDVLSSIFGDLGLFIEDIVSYMITNESCTFQYYSNFMRNHPVMDKNIRDDTQISRLLKYNIKEQDINLFLRAWNQMNNTKECIYVGYDSTNFNTNAYGIELADYGHPKVDEGLPQYNLAYAVNQKDSTPLFYELYDGSVIDNTELEIMLEEAKEFGHEKLGVLMDRGYISEKNIKALRTKGYEYILMMKQNQRICQEIIEEYGAAVQSLEGYYIGEHGVYGTTVKKQLYGQETNIHVYYDDIRASEEKVALMSRYETWEKEIEKKVSKKAFADMLPESVAWRQKEQFSDGVGYNWIDTLKAVTAAAVSDEQMRKAAERFPVNTPMNKEEYYYRTIFEEHFPSESAARSVPSVPSVACSTAEALAWDVSFQGKNDPSGRAVAGVHEEAYKD